MDQISIVLFSGGRGAATISKAIQNHPQLHLTSIVNAYDDGLSTGKLRKFIPNMLGPSDLRKNISSLMPQRERSQIALKALLDFRFAQNEQQEKGAETIYRLASGNRKVPIDNVQQILGQITNKDAEWIAGACEKFMEYERRLLKKACRLDYQDCSLGNIIFSGIFLSQRGNFNKSVSILSSYCELSSNVLNATNGENLVLVALKEDGQFLPNEASIVAPQSSVPIGDIYLLNDYLSAEEIECLNGLNYEKRRALLHSRVKYPSANPDAIAALKKADVIIYGPGTQHSSLFPTYLTKGMPETIASNLAAKKIFIGNIQEDHDIPGQTIEALIASFYRYMTQSGKRKDSLSSFINEIYVEKKSAYLEQRGSETKYISYNQMELSDNGVAVNEASRASRQGAHVGGQIVHEMLATIRLTANISIMPHRYLVSIIVPVLNEAATVQRVLKELLQLEMSDASIEVEIIVSDGGSTDGSLEAIQGVPGVRCVASEAKCGRGTAIRRGIQEAKGDIIVLFPSDGEYWVNDIIGLIRPILANEFRCVIGSRAIKCFNLGGRIRHIYEGNFVLYVLSKYGGIFMSLLCLLLYNRYITDLLSTLKAYDRWLLDELELAADGVELEAEAIAKVLKLNEYVLEVPVHYFPRKRSEGKKMSVSDGLRVIGTLCIQRIRRGRKASDRWNPLEPSNCRDGQRFMRAP